MKEEVYNFLREYGFTKEEVKSFQEENEKMFFTTIEEITKNIKFLENKNLTKEEIMTVLKNNPFMITEKNNRLDYLDKIYIEDLKMDTNTIKELIIKNNETYTASPIQLEKIINHLKEHNCTIETIKNFIINNPSVIIMDFIEYEKLVKFN